MAELSSSHPDDHLFLPDFCDIRTVFALVLVGELLAFVLVLAPATEPSARWSHLAFISLFVQWVALASAALLCVGRRWLRRLSNNAAGVTSYLLVILLTVAVSEFSYWVVHGNALTENVSASGHLEFLLRNVGIAAIVSAVVLRYLYVQFQWRSNVESEASARIQALQSRIRPHFLFNSMNTIASLTRSQPEVAEQVVEDLADLFRMSLGDARVPVTLGRELELCQQYARIEQQRLGDRLHAEWSLDDLPRDARIPGLSLQPLVENAIYHGIEPAPDGGVLQVAGERRDGQLAVVIRNTLPPPDGGAHHSGKSREGNRIAQDNVQQRLRAFFGGGAGLAIDATDKEYIVRVEFPYTRESE